MRSLIILCFFTCSIIFYGINISAQDKTFKNPVVSGSDFSELSLSKTFKGESIQTTKKISIGTNFTSLEFHLIGNVKSGTITVILLKPNGTVSRNIIIDATSNVDFKQTIDLSKNNTDATGDWQLKIQAEEADGFYKLVINTR